MWTDEWFHVTWKEALAGCCSWPAEQWSQQLDKDVRGMQLRLADDKEPLGRADVWMTE